MESYSQPWTVINKPEKEGDLPKTWEYVLPNKHHQHHHQYSYESTKPVEYYLSKYEQGVKPAEYETTSPYYKNHNNCSYKYESYKPEYEKFEKRGEFELYEKMCEKRPESYEKLYEKRPEYETKQSEWEQIKAIANKPEWAVDILSDYEKVYEKLERLNMGKPHHEQHYRQHCYEQKRSCCCVGDDEMVGMTKELICMLMGAEQSYLQLGFLCMDERFTLVNTSEYFRLCSLRMRWLANGLIRRSVRLFNVHEWINSTHFENCFKVPSKEELASNDFTHVVKTLFKIVIEAEERISERMTRLGNKMVKSQCEMQECRFDGCRWFVSFVLPQQTKFMRRLVGHVNSIEMSQNGYIFDKCEMAPIVANMEESVHELVKSVLPKKPLTHHDKIYRHHNKHY